MILLKAILLSVLTGYAIRYLCPMTGLVFWQVFVAPLVRSIGGKHPTDLGNFFYAPVTGQPLVLRWLHPRHSMAIPQLISKGAICALILLNGGEEGDRLLQFVITLGAILLLLCRTIEWMLKSQPILDVSKNMLFVNMAIIEMYAIAAIVRLVLVA